MGRSKTQIAKEWKKLTFSDMKGVRERSANELDKVLAYAKKIKKR